MSEQAKHTPGPWRACDRVVVVHPDDHGFSTWLANCAVGGNSGAEQTANARLIAAAPDMYEELKSLMEDRRIALGSTRRKRIAAIIAEAEGRS